MLMPFVAASTPITHPNGSLPSLPSSLAKQVESCQLQHSDLPGATTFLQKPEVFGSTALPDQHRPAARSTWLASTGVGSTSTSRQPEPTGVTD